MHHSLFAFGQFRNPLIKMKIPGAVADVVNNVFFSPKWQYVLSFGDEWARIQANVVGNYKIAGKSCETIIWFISSKKADAGTRSI